MANEIVTTNIQRLLEGWLEAERNGVEFPVPFDAAWPMAGYKRKDSARRYLPKVSADKLYHVSRIKTNGRPKEVIRLSIEGLKHVCLMADTDEGSAIRQYFIESEAKWKLVQQIAPRFAQEIDVIHEQQKLEALKAATYQSELALLQYRGWVTNLPEPVQQKILGHKLIEKTEYIDRCLLHDQYVQDGSTVNKTYLCKRYGFLTRSGSPDYKALGKFLSSSGLPSDAIRLTAQVREGEELRREYLPDLDQAYQGWSDRSLFLGES